MAVDHFVRWAERLEDTRTKSAHYPDVDKRDLFRDVMLGHGFKPYEAEWWHFTLKQEPYPETYFDFPVE